MPVFALAAPLSAPAVAALNTHPRFCSCVECFDNDVKCINDNYRRHYDNN